MLKPISKRPEPRAKTIQNLMEHGVPREAALEMTAPPHPRQPEVKPGSVDWLMQRNVPREAAEGIQDPGPSKFDPQEGTPDWLVQRNVPRESAKVIGREPDPIPPDQYYWGRLQHILDDPKMSPFMKDYLLAQLNERYHFYTPDLSGYHLTDQDILFLSNQPIREMPPEQKAALLIQLKKGNGELSGDDLIKLGIVEDDQKKSLYLMGPDEIASIYKSQYKTAEYGYTYDELDWLDQRQKAEEMMNTVFLLSAGIRAGGGANNNRKGTNGQTSGEAEPEGVVDKGKPGGDNGTKNALGNPTQSNPSSTKTNVIPEGITKEGLKAVASKPGNRGVTPIGRAFQKHTAAFRAGTFAGEQSGSAEENNTYGMLYLNKILDNPGTTYT